MGTPRRRPWSVPDTLVAVAFTILAALIYSGLWSDLDRSYLIAGGSDQILWEWLFTVAAEAVRQGENPLFTDLQNAPSGVNLMANTAVLGLALPLAPITWAWGATVTYALALTGSLAASAVAWYWVFSRHLVTHRVPAVVGATACTFAPGVISHGQAHVNFVAWFVLPFITLAMVRIVRGARPVRDGVGLGLLASYQILLGEELLLVFGVMLLVAGVAVLAPRGRALVGAVRPAAVGFGVGTAVVLVAVGYPLWFQFAGPQSYTGLALGLAGNDTAAFTRFATQSVAGVPSAIAEVTLNRTEENASFGWPLIVMVLVVSVWLWREPLPRALAITAATMAWLSTGATLVVAGEDTGVPGPWVLLGTLPSSTPSWCPAWPWGVSRSSARCSPWQPSASSTRRRPLPRRRRACPRCRSACSGPVPWWRSCCRWRRRPCPSWRARRCPPCSPRARGASTSPRGRRW